MDHIIDLHQTLIQKFPAGKITLSEPKNNDGYWILSVEIQGQQFEVEWASGRKTSLGTPYADGYGQALDETLPDLDTALNRLLSLIDSRGVTAPALPIVLAELRERRGVTQSQLARYLKVSQATISGLERRDEIHVSSLYKFIGALGGLVRVEAIFSDAIYNIKIDNSDGGGNVEGRLLRYGNVAREVRAFIPNFSALEKSGSLDKAQKISDGINSRKSIFEFSE